MLAAPTPPTQAEIRPRVAVTSASKFKTEPEALAEAKIPSGKYCPSQVLGWDKGMWERSKALHPLGAADRAGPGRAAWGSAVHDSTVWEGDPESPYVPLGVLTGPTEKRGTASGQLGRVKVRTKPTASQQKAFSYISCHPLRIVPQCLPKPSPLDPLVSGDFLVRYPTANLPPSHHGK